MKLVARQSIELSLDAFRWLVPADLDLVPASALHTLSQYHANCRDALAKLLHPTYWHQESHGYYTFPPLWDVHADDGKHAVSCRSSHWKYVGQNPIVDEWAYDFYGFDEDVKFTSREWFQEYLDDVKSSLLSDRQPLRLALHNPKAFQRALKEAFRCPYCSQDAAASLATFAHNVVLEVDHALDQVRLRDTHPRVLALY